MLALFPTLYVILKHRATTPAAVIFVPAWSDARPMNKSSFEFPPWSRIIFGSDRGSVSNNGRVAQRGSVPNAATRAWEEKLG